MNFIPFFIRFSWFVQTSHLYSPFVLVRLFSSMLFLACEIFQIDLVIELEAEISFVEIANILSPLQQLKHPDFNFGLILAGTVNSAMYLFAYCFAGKMATESFEKMLICVYESNWYELPLDLQRALVIISINSQQVYYYHGFGIAVLNLETFAKVSSQFYLIQRS